MTDDHRGDPILVILPVAWKIHRGNLPTLLARPAGFVVWMRDNLNQPWRYTDDGFGLLFDDLSDATHFMLRWG